MINENKWYFIPDNVSVGTFNSERTFTKAKQFDQLAYRPTVSDFAFITCKFKYNAWLSSGIFERLTKGYKPSNQRDRAAQLEKAVTGIVSEIQNEPVAGFKVVMWCANPYSFCSKEYERAGDIVLFDPRGFCISLPQHSFFKTLNMSGMNMSDGELTGKYSYGWDTLNKTMTLIPETYSKFQEWKTRSEECKIKNNGKYFVPNNDLQPGKVYRAGKILSGDWMYVGRFNTYSQECHIGAFDRGGRYDVKKYVKLESGRLRQKWGIIWPTTEGKMIFYSMTPNNQRYVIRSNANEIFSAEVKPDADGLYHDKTGNPYLMYSDGDPVTFERVMDDVSLSPAFNKIRFTDDPQYELIPEYALEYDFGNKNHLSRVFPFSRRYDACIVRSQNGKYHKIVKYANSNEHRVYEDLSQKFAYTSKFCPLIRTVYISSMAEFKKEFKPTYPVYALENGKPVRLEHALMFIPHMIRTIAGQFY